MDADLNRATHPVASRTDQALELELPDMPAQVDTVVPTMEVLVQSARALVAAQRLADSRWILGEWLEQAPHKTPFSTPRSTSGQRSLAEVDHHADIPTLLLDPSNGLLPYYGGKLQADGVPCWLEALLCICELGDRELEAHVRMMLAGSRGPV